MGKKRIIKKPGGNSAGRGKQGLGKVPKRKLSSGILHIQSTYNNTLITLTDKKGDAVMQLSSGAMGFKGAKKGTPFASSKIASILVDKAKIMGVSDIDVIVKGVGAGRESAIRTFASKGIEINSIKDVTPVPHNGPKPKKPRRV